jgi:asparagine synthase (glutamine-hydrolysing)
VKDVVSNIELFIKGLDQPSVDGLNTFLVSQYAKQNVTVSLSGLGGDELFNGYAWQHRFYKATSTDVFIGNALSPLEQSLKHIGILGRKLNNRFIYNTTAHKHYSKIHILFQAHQLQTLFTIPVNQHIIEKSLSPIFVTDTYSRLQQINKLDLRYFMGAQLLRDSDALSMINSLEVRFPLIDTRLVEYVYNLPDEFKIHHNLSVSQINKGYEQFLSYKDGGVKKLLFDAFEQELPKSLTKRSKRGFKMPYEQWMQEDIWIKDIIQSLLNLEGCILKPGATGKLLSGWQAKKVSWQQIWSLVVLQKWMTLNHIEFDT